MVILQHRSNRKSAGGRYKSASVRRQHQMGSRPTLTTVGERRSVTEKKLGGEDKHRLLSAESANVYDAKAKKYTQAKITTIIDNPANRNYARRNIITCGALIDTSAGKARVTNRPGQEGAINAVLIKE